jgi:hypothetical protein
LRRGDGRSISGADLWGPEKLRSKKEVLASALSCLTSTRVSPAALRTFAAAVIVDHAKGRRLNEAWSICRTVAELGIFNRRERLLLSTILLLYSRVMSRLPMAKGAIAVAMRPFAADSTIGLIPWRKPSKAATPSPV